MFLPVRFLRAAPLAALAVLFLPALGHAGPLVALGGGVSKSGLLEPHYEPWTPMGWLSLRGDFGEFGSAFARAGYERHEDPLGLAVCLGPDCPRVQSATRRAIYVPLSVGLRVSAPRRGVSRSQAYVEAASSLAWTRFERDVVLEYAGGSVLHDFRASRHWLPGFELGAGLTQRLFGGLGMEWGIRYAYRGVPRQTGATVAYEIEGDDVLRQMSLVAALTLGP